MSHDMSGKLYIVPTPVGNMADMTPRAIEVLRAADRILAEDTRTSAVLMQRFDITTPMSSHHFSLNTPKGEIVIVVGGKVDDAPKTHENKYKKTEL